MSGNPYDENYNEDELSEKEVRIIKHITDKAQKKLVTTEGVDLK